MILIIFRNELDDNKTYVEHGLALSIKFTLDLFVKEGKAETMY